MSNRRRALVAVAGLAFPAVASGGIFTPGQIIFSSLNRVAAVHPSNNPHDAVQLGQYQSTDFFPIVMQGLAYDAVSGDLFAVDTAAAHSYAADASFPGAARVIRISGVDGSATVLGDCQDFARPSLDNCWRDAMAIDVVSAGPHAGKLAIVDPRRNDGAGHTPANNDGEVWILDPSTGVRTLLSAGDLMYDPHGIAAGPDGRLYAADTHGFVVEIDPLTGLQSLLAEIDGAAGIAWDDVAGGLVVSSPGVGVFRLDPESGAATLLSPTAKPRVAEFGLSIEASGDIALADPSAYQRRSSNGGIFRVSGADGRDTILLANSNSSSVCCLSGSLEVIRP